MGETLDESQSGDAGQSVMGLYGGDWRWLTRGRIDLRPRCLLAVRCADDDLDHFHEHWYRGDTRGHGHENDYDRVQDVGGHDHDHSIRPNPSSRQKQDRQSFHR